jgi:hypothetical protein
MECWIVTPVYGKLPGASNEAGVLPGEDLVLRKLTLTAMVAAVGAMFVAAPAWAQYPPSSGSLHVGSSTVGAGGALSISGSGCAADGSVTFAVSGTAAGSTTADGTGAFTGSVTIPSGASGSVAVTATCDDSTGAPLVLTATVTVSSGGGLPFTGSSSTMPGLALAVVLLCVGSAFIVAVRRRSTRSRVGV